MIGSITLSIPFGLLFLAAMFGFVKIYNIPTGGMSPTLQKGDSIFASKTDASADQFKRGDTVVFTVDGMHFNGTKMQGTYVQRLVALPGDTITIVGGAVHVNGQRVEMDGRISQAPPSSRTKVSFPLVVPVDHLFMMGDNYGNSLDSRYFGPIEASRVTHRPYYRVLPFSRLGEIN